MGLFVYYFGSKKKYSDVAHHTIYFGESYEKHLHKIFEKKILSDDISYYLPVSYTHLTLPTNREV